MRYGSLGVAIAVVAGLAGGVSCDARVALVAALTLSAGWATALLAYVRQWPRLLMVALGLVVCASGWALGARARDRALHPSLRAVLDHRFGGLAIDSVESRIDEPVVVEGRLREDARITASGVTLGLDVSRLWFGDQPLEGIGGVALGVGGALHDAYQRDWTAGRMIRAPVVFRRPARYLNPGLADQEHALARRGITLVGTIKSAQLIEVVAKGQWWEEWAARLRARTRLAIARYVRPRGELPAAIAVALLIGDRTGLDDEVERRLQEAGTYHVLAISGGNIAILTGLVLGALSLLGLPRRLAAVTTAGALSVYCLIAVGSASVIRAALTAVVYLVVRAIDHRAGAANVVGLSAGLMLLAAPLAVSDVGFWLTFGATAAILAGATSIGERGAFGRLLIGVLVATVCVEVSLAPIGALIFQRVTIAGLLLNFVALPAMTVVQIAAMALVACDRAGLTDVARWAAVFVHAGSLALVDSARVVDHAPWVTWRVPSPSMPVLAAYYASLLASIGLHRGMLQIPHRSNRCGKWLASSVAAALLLWIVVAPAARFGQRGDGRLHLTQIDVGQGDALLVSFPNGRTLLVDSGGGAPGGSFDIGDRIMAPVLRARGLLGLDYVAITHGDPDHLGGARAIVRDFRPQEIWWGVPVANHEPTAHLVHAARVARSAWRTLQRGDRLQIDEVELRVHHPPPPDWERQKVRNNDSLVLELRYQEVSMLLTGDIGREIEQELMPRLDLLPIVVLKVAHHGSATSSSGSFLNKVKPAIALIGVGRSNLYGHPVREVLDRLHLTGAIVFRTDIDGAIDVITDGSNIEVRTRLGRTWATKR